MREAGASLDFLGYTFRFERDLKGRDLRYLNLTPSKRSEARIRAELKTLTGHGSVPLSQMVERTSRKLLWWGRYFARGYPSRTFRRIDYYVQVRMESFLRHKSQRRMKPPEGLTPYEWLHSLGLVRLGDPQTIARLQSSKPRRRIHG